VIELRVEGVLARKAEPWGPQRKGALAIVRASDVNGGKCVLEAFIPPGPEAASLLRLKAGAAVSLRGALNGRGCVGLHMVVSSVGATAKTAAAQRGKPAVAKRLTFDHLR